MKKKDKLKFQDLVWIFTIVCFFGYIWEILWHFLSHNFTFLIKNGTLFGPFQPIYGFGVLIITILLWKVKDKNWFVIFILGAILGSLFEYGASLFQEYAFGSYSWHYSKYGKLSINGIIYVPYCIGWGILTLVWIKVFMMKLINTFRKIPTKINNVLVTIITIFMVFNLACTCMVFYRKTARYNEIDPRNKIEEFFDKHYNDEVTSARFPNLWIIE